MTPEEMDALVDRHVAAELAGDFDGAVAVYCDDVEHDFAAAPHPAVGRAAARQIYADLDAAFTTEQMTLVRRYHGEGFCVTEHHLTGTVKGPFPGMPPEPGRVSARLLHLFEFRGGQISRENVWAGPFLPVAAE